MSKYDKELNKLLSKAQTDIEKYSDKITLKITQWLRKKYKGKKVKCVCFDHYTDGEDYCFDDTLLDIEAYKPFNKNDFVVDVTFNYEGLSGTKKPTPCTFHLTSIEKVS